MIDIRFIQSMLARNKTQIRNLEIVARSLDFSGFSVAWAKKDIAKLAQIQVALKAEVSRQKWVARGIHGIRCSKKHGMNDPRYTAFIQSCKD